MDFNLSNEQQLLQDSVARFVVTGYDFEKRAALLKGSEGGSPDHWRMFADHGWLGAAIPEECGGLGGSLVDTLIISQQFGRGLVIEPYLGCALLAAQTVLAAGSEAERERWLPGMADGTRRWALAYSEPSSRGMPQWVATRAERVGEGYRLHGHKTLVLGAPHVDAYIVSARIREAPAIGDDVSLFVVDAKELGSAVTRTTLHDGTLAAELRLESMQAQVLGRVGHGLPALQEALAHALLALCAELIGGMERAIEMTAEYLRSRKQFNVQLASFQSLQHRMADMAAEMELARSMLFAAMAAHVSESGAARYESAGAAKAFIARAAKNVCGQAIQLHGAIGMTEEYLVGHFFKRAAVADLLLGSSLSHEAAGARRLQRRDGRESGENQ